jgi:hypothetical protein
MEKRRHQPPVFRIFREQSKQKLGGAFHHRVIFAKKVGVAGKRVVFQRCWHSHAPPVGHMPYRAASTGAVPRQRSVL